MRSAVPTLLPFYKYYCSYHTDNMLLSVSMPAATLGSVALLVSSVLSVLSELSASLVSDSTRLCNCPTLQIRYLLHLLRELFPSCRVRSGLLPNASHSGLSCCFAVLSPDPSIRGTVHVHDSRYHNGLQVHLISRIRIASRRFACPLVPLIAPSATQFIHP